MYDLKLFKSLKVVFCEDSNNNNLCYLFITTYKILLIEYYDKV